MSKQGIITEQGDLGLGFEQLDEEDQKTLDEKKKEDKKSSK